MERRVNKCEVCGLEVYYEPATNSWGESLQLWRKTCAEKTLTESDEKIQPHCPHFSKTLAPLIY